LPALLTATLTPDTTAGSDTAAGMECSVADRGDPYENPTAETVDGLHTAKLINKRR
jgi:hypothetical protein